MMTRTELLKTVRAFKGYIYAGVLARNDILYVRVTKTDLLEQLALIADNELEVNVVNGSLYISSANV